jgi:hypothetical protein
MADFTARYTDGTTVALWTDPSAGGVPSRIRPFPERPHHRDVGVIGTEVEVTASVDGVEGEVDANLADGFLFALHFAEYPVALPLLSSPVGQSSVQRFTPSAAGHYTFKLKREEHGEIYFHLDVT